MEDDQFRCIAAQHGYALFCRQALRFILNNYGEEALDRFVTLARPMAEASYKNNNTPGINRIRELTLEMIDRDVRIVKDKPDMI